MCKRVIKKVVCLFSAIILTIYYGSFSVFATTEHDFITVPESAIGAFEYWSKNGVNTVISINEQSAQETTTGTLKWGNYTSTYEGFLSKTTVNGDAAQARYIGLADLNVNLSTTHNQYTKLTYDSMVLSGYKQATGYDGSKSISISGGSEMIMVFMCSKLVNVSDITTYTNNNANVNIERIYGSPKVGSLYMQCFKFTSSQYTVCTIKWGNITSTDYIRPMLFKAKSQMTDDELKLCAQETKTESLLFEINTNITNIADIIVNGTSESNQKVNDNDNMTSDFSDLDNSWHDIESSNLDNMQLQMQEVGTNNYLYNNGGFINAVNFISSNFMRLLNDDDSKALELLITFSLILGLSLTIIGKLRN